MTARAQAPPGKGPAAEVNGGREVERLGGGSDIATIPRPADQDDAKPRCTAVGVYCESLGWLRREPACPASVCCRSYWADAEAVAS